MMSLFKLVTKSSWRKL